MSMNRAALSLSLVASLAVAALGCKSKATKQSEQAAADVVTLQGVLASRHVDSLPKALPLAAAKLSVPTAESGDKLSELRDGSDDLRAAKRSFYALVDAKGVVVYVDESNWKIVDRVMTSFPPVVDVLAGKAPFARGSGRFGGEGDDTLTFVDAVPLRDPSDKSGGIVGALIDGWEAHDIASDLQAQLLTQQAMAAASAGPRGRVKQSDLNKKAMEDPDVWVALFKGPLVFLQEGAFEPLVDAAKGLDLATKTAGGARWRDTFDVARATWGGAAERTPALGDDVGIAVFRHLP